jgi:hypothetical protein
MPALVTLTDPAAVDPALDEFDNLGRDGFLAKYGFGPARSYFLVRNRRLYDSKAIFGAAYGFQYPDEGPLRAQGFSGGDRTVAHRLRALGFDVRNTASEGSRSYWALVADPAVCRIDEAVRSLEMDLWTTGRSAVSAGDRVAIWRAAGRDGRRGVVAFAEVLTDPEEQTDEDNPFWIDPARGAMVKPRALVRYVSAPNLPLWVGQDGAEVLEDLSVFRARGGTVFRISDEQWSALITAAGGWEGLSPEGNALLTEASPRRSLRGQRFGLSAEQRRLVEERAMELAKTHYRKEWSEVEDRSARAPYDLYCRSYDSHLCVEVKGTTSREGSVLLTRNEVDLSAREHPNTALFVVSDIQITVDEGGNPVATGGTVREIRPWRASDMTLRPIAFECTLSPAGA